MVKLSQDQQKIIEVFKRSKKSKNFKELKEKTKLTPSKLTIALKGLEKKLLLSSFTMLNKQKLYMIKDYNEDLIEYLASSKIRNPQRLLKQFEADLLLLDIYELIKFYPNKRSFKFTSKTRDLLGYSKTIKPSKI